jgi:HEAT repeat protein
MRPRGKRLALLLAGLGVCVLVAAVLVFRERIAEKYYLHKLEHGAEEEADPALDALLAMESAAALPFLLGRIRRLRDVAFHHEFGGPEWIRRLEADREAFRRIYRRHRKEVSETLYRSLREGDFYLRREIIQLMWEIGRELDVAVPLLVTVLRDDPDDQLRFVAAAFLPNAAPAPAEVLPVLLETLEDPDLRVRGAAIGALGDIGTGSPEVSEALAALVSDAAESPRARCRASDSLKAIGARSEKVVAALRGAAEDPNEYVRQAAAEALKTIAGRARGGGRNRTR